MYGWYVDFSHFAYHFFKTFLLSLILENKLLVLFYVLVQLFIGFLEYFCIMLKYCQRQGMILTAKTLFIYVRGFFVLVCKFYLTTRYQRWVLIRFG